VTEQKTPQMPSNGRTDRHMKKQVSILYIQKIDGSVEDITVDTATRLRVGRPRKQSSIRGRSKKFSLLHNVQTVSGPTQPPYNGYWGLFSWRSKRQGSKADHSTPSSANAKNGGAAPPPPIRVHRMVLN
jgi:hypothetical protein